MFRDHLLELDNFSDDLSLEKTDSPSLHSHWLPIALHPRVGPCEISPNDIGSLTGLVSMQFKQPYCWDVMGTALCHVEKRLAAGVLILWLTHLLSSFHDVPWALGIGVALQLCPLGIGTSLILDITFPITCFWISFLHFI